MPCACSGPLRASSEALKGMLGEQESWKGAALWLAATRLMTGPCAADWGQEGGAQQCPGLQGASRAGAAPKQPGSACQCCSCALSVRWGQSRHSISQPQCCERVTRSAATAGQRTEGRRRTARLVGAAGRQLPSLHTASRGLPAASA